MFGAKAMGQGQHFTCDFTQANTCPILTHHITPIYVREIVGDLMNVKGSSYFEMTPGSHKEMWGPVSWFTIPNTIGFTVSVERGLPTRQDWQGAMLYKLLYRKCIDITIQTDGQIYLS
jgi:hypothetical protein